MRYYITSELENCHDGHGRCAGRTGAHRLGLAQSGRAGDLSPELKDEAAAAILKTRTLTNLYNERPTWLANAHAALDQAVAAVYGWPEDIAIDDALARLLELNLVRTRPVASEAA